MKLLKSGTGIVRNATTGQNGNVQPIESQGKARDSESPAVQMGNCTSAVQVSADTTSTSFSRSRVECTGEKNFEEGVSMDPVPPPALAAPPPSDLASCAGLGPAPASPAPAVAACVLGQRRVSPVVGLAEGRFVDCPLTPSEGYSRGFKSGSLSGEHVCSVEPQNGFITNQDNSGENSRCLPQPLAQSHELEQESAVKHVFRANAQKGPRNSQEVPGDEDRGSLPKQLTQSHRLEQAFSVDRNVDGSDVNTPNKRVVSASDTVSSGEGGHRGHKCGLFDADPPVYSAEEQQAKRRRLDQGKRRDFSGCVTLAAKVSALDDQTSTEFSIAKKPRLSASNCDSSDEPINHGKFVDKTQSQVQKNPMEKSCVAERTNLSEASNHFAANHVHSNVFQADDYQRSEDGQILAQRQDLNVFGPQGKSHEFVDDCANTTGQEARRREPSLTQNVVPPQSETVHVPGRPVCQRFVNGESVLLAGQLELVRVHEAGATQT